MGDVMILYIYIKLMNVCDIMGIWTVVSQLLCCQLVIAVIWR